MGAVLAGLAVTAVGAGVSAYASSQAGKGSGQSRSMNELSSLPYKEQLKQARAYAKQDLQFQKDATKQAIELYPRVAQAQRTEAMRSLAQLYPGFVQREATATTSQRGNDLADLQRFGGDYAQALGGASSAYGAIDDTVQAGPGNALLDYLNAAAGPSDIRTELERQALEELQAGGNLTASEQRGVQQGARAAYSDRGLVMSNPAIADEFLQRDLYSRQRQNERRGFAVGARQLGLQEDQFGLGVQGANEANAGNWRNFLISGSQAQLNPLLQYGMQRASIRPETLAGFGGAGMSPGQALAPINSTAPTVGSAANAMSPLYGYAADVYGTNFNAAESRAQNRAAGYAAIGGGLMSAGGGIMGGMGGGGGGYGGQAIGSAGPYGSTYSGSMYGQSVYRPAYA